MGNQRDTFAKRRREQARKDKARDKKERLATRRAEALAAKNSPTGPDDAAQGVVDETPGDAPPLAPPLAATNDVPSQ